MRIINISLYMWILIYLCINQLRFLSMKYYFRKKVEWQDIFRIAYYYACIDIIMSSYIRELSLFSWKTDKIEGIYFPWKSGWAYDISTRNNWHFVIFLYFKLTSLLKWNLFPLWNSIFSLSQLNYFVIKNNYKMLRKFCKIRN